MACILKAAVFSEEDSRLILQLDSSWGPGDKCGLQRSSIVSGFIKTGINNDSAPQPLLTAEGDDVGPPEGEALGLFVGDCGNERHHGTSRCQR